MTKRSEIVKAAINGIQQFVETTRGANIVKEIKRTDDHSFTKEQCEVLFQRERRSFRFILEFWK